MKIQIVVCFILVCFLPIVSSAGKGTQDSNILFVDGFPKPAALSATNPQINILVEFAILADLITTYDPLIIEWELHGKGTLHPENSVFTAGPFRISVPFDAPLLAEAPGNSVRYKTVQSMISFKGNLPDSTVIPDDRYNLQFKARLMRSKREPRNLGKAELDGQILRPL